MEKNFKEKFTKATAGLIAACVMLCIPINADGAEENSKHAPEEPSTVEETESSETQGTESETETETDTDAPILRGIFTDSKCYEPTKTDTKQYFSEDFVLKGSFCDNDSGVDKIE